MHAQHFPNFVLIREACGVTLVHKQQLVFRVPDELFSVAPLDIWPIFIIGEGCTVLQFIMLVPCFPRFLRLRLHL